MITLEIGNVEGLPAYEQAQLNELVKVFRYHQEKNAKKEKYYEGHISLHEVNLGVALPADSNLRNLEIGCEWGGKCVDVLASRSMFDGYVGSNGEENATASRIAFNNKLMTEYAKACRDELKFGCTFATLSADDAIGCRIRFHSPQTAAALWDGSKGRIDCGLAIIDSQKDESDNTWKPSLVNMYTEDAVYVLTKAGSLWSVQAHPHTMGRPLMEPLVWNATSAKPFGRSRIKEPVRHLIEGYVRTIANATIGLEFSTSPQKYLLGLTDEQYDAIINQKFRQYVGSLIAATSNPETGEKPTFGQLSQGNIEPHVQMIRILATQFSAATGLSVTDTGVVNDANPTSSEAIIAQTQTLIMMAEQLNRSNGDALRTIMIMAQAIAENKTVAELPDEATGVIAHFKNPAMPSVASTADAATKISAVRPEFASTDTFLEMIGFDQADIRRIKAQEQRARGQKILVEEFGNADINTGMAELHREDVKNKPDGSGADAGVDS